MKNKLSNILFEKVDSTGLGVFRICYTVVLFFEVLQLFTYRKIIYDDIPFVDAGELTISYLFLFWFIALFFILIGLFTKYAVIINYIFSVIIFSSAAKFEYHVFYIYVGLNFLLMFMPISRSLSFDLLINKLKYTNIGNQYIPDNKVYAANYLMPVFMCIGLQYFDSTLFKYTNQIWQDGLGLWLPANMPMGTWADTSWYMNSELIVRFSSYFVLLFETLFIFIFWFKPFRLPIALLGILFHIGILVEFPIPWFALCVISIYLLLIPVSFWKKTMKIFRLKSHICIFYYDSECPLCAKTVVFIRHIDIFHAISCKAVQTSAGEDKALKKYSEEELLINIHLVTKSGDVYIGYDAYSQLFKSLIYAWPLGLLMTVPGLKDLGKNIYSKIAGQRLTERCTIDNCPIPEFSRPIRSDETILINGLTKDYISRKFWMNLLIFLIIGQFCISWFSPLIRNSIENANLEDSYVNRGMYKINQLVQRPLVKFLGITKHPLFMDSHFKDYNHIVKVDIWNNGKYENIGLLEDNGMVGKHIQGCTWAHYTFRTSSPILDQIKLETGLAKYISLYHEYKNAHFKISIKEIDIPTKWEKDFLKKQMAHPWKQGGVYTFKTGFIWNNYMLEIFDQEKQSK